MKGAELIHELADKNQLGYGGSAGPTLVLPPDWPSTRSPVDRWGSVVLNVAGSLPCALAGCRWSESRIGSCNSLFVAAEIVIR